MDCQAVQQSERPKLPPEYFIDWAKVATVGQAKTEHEKFVMALRTRERTVSYYVVELEGDLFACANDAAWLREREAEIER